MEQATQSRQSFLEVRLELLQNTGRGVSQSLLRRVSFRPVAPMNGVHTLEFANPRGVFDPEYAIRVDTPRVAKANASSFGGPNMGTVQPLNRMTAIGSSTETGPRTRVVEPSPPGDSSGMQSARITCRSSATAQGSGAPRDDFGTSCNSTTRTRPSTTYIHFAFCSATLSATHSPASLVPSDPPISCVVFFCRTASSTAASIFSASRVIPRCASIIAAVRIAPNGFAMFLPAIGGAEPCTGSNIEVFPG